MNIKTNIGKYFNLFVSKVIVSKINDNRKHLKLQIIFNFKKNYEEIEINLNQNNIYYTNKKVSLVDNQGTQGLLN